MECECLVCLAEKSGREFREFANTWVRDNIQCVKPKEELTEIKKGTRLWYKYKVEENVLPLSTPTAMEPHEGFESPKHEPIELRSHEWSKTTTDVVADRQARAEAERERPTRSVVDLVPRHSSPRDDRRGTESTGRKVMQFREHEISVIWQPNTSTRPPSAAGAFSSWQMSPKTRRRVTNAGKWLTTKHPHGCFITLTYDRPICDTEAKRHLDNWLKRLARSPYKPEGVLWVAERTKRHYIHFHVICSNYVSADWMQTAWRAVTGLKLWTNVREVTKYTAPYVVKYAAKSDRAYIWGRRWGQSQYVANGAKVNWRSEVSDCTWEEFVTQNEGPSLPRSRVKWLKNGYLLEMKVTPAKRKWFPKENKD